MGAKKKRGVKSRPFVRLLGAGLRWGVVWGHPRVMSGWGGARKGSVATDGSGRTRIWV